MTQTWFKGKAWSLLDPEEKRRRIDRAVATSSAIERTGEIEGERPGTCDSLDLLI
jgi:hypothetical protein